LLASLVAAALAALAALVCASSASAAGVHVGVGRADITPPTGGYKGGWSCTCAKALGQHERVYARAIVIDEGGHKVALVTEDLFAVSAGMVRDATAELPGLGYSEQNVIVSATHTHSSQAGFMNFSSYNSILPANSDPTLQGITNSATDQVMYDFMTHQLALAIQRADSDLKPGAIGWGQTQLLGVTQNRSLGAHLADFGITNGGANGGSVSQDPGGYPDTIDPTVNVLRVDQYAPRARRGKGRAARRRLVPVGIYSTFANHGTVDHEDFSSYSADHQGAAERVVEAAIRSAGHVPAGQDVVNAFADSDAGDTTSGINDNGPAYAEQVGREEAQAMMTAWRQAGHAMTAAPVVDTRWTRVCFCGAATSGGTPDSSPWIGLAAAAGSEEGRTIFYNDGIANEGAKLPLDVGPQGDKIISLDEKGSIPQAAPFTVMRIGDRLIVSVPGEATVGLGKLIRNAVASVVGGSGIGQIVLVGYANEYLSYFTTPAEYEQQAYEGGFTLYGKDSGYVLRDTLVGLAHRLVAGTAAPAPYAYDPSNGVHPTAATYGPGPSTATATAQPAGTNRLGHVAFSWHGGPNGIDRPVDSAFVTVQRLRRRRWVSQTNDLGMQIVWSSDTAGSDTAQWEVPLTARAGTYRFLVTAKLYRLTSRRFAVATGAILTPRVVAGGIELDYPDPPSSSLQDWTYRPPDVSRGLIAYVVNGRRRVLRATATTVVPIPAGARVVIPAGGARDRNGNTNPQRFVLR
jgi:neutral ceramidase